MLPSSLRSGQYKHNGKCKTQSVYNICHGKLHLYRTNLHSRLCFETAYISSPIKFSVSATTIISTVGVNDKSQI